MNTLEVDPFSDVLNTTESKEITIEDIKRLDYDVEEWCEKVESDKDDTDDLTVLEVAIAKILETVSPASFWHLLCPSCGICFESDALWQQHIDEIHFFYNFVMLPVYLTEDSQHYACKTCPAVFNCTEYRKIRQHAFSHMRYNYYYKCALCDHMERCEIAIGKHIKRHMEVHLLKAKVDDKILRAKKYQLSDHIAYEKFLIYVCPECQAVARNYDAWQEHVIKEHALLTSQQLDFHTKPIDEEEPPACISTTCNTCNQTLLCDNLESCQQKHYLTHLPFRAFRCGLCSMHFNYRGEIKMHMILLHCKNRSLYEEAILPPNMRTGAATFDLHFKFLTGNRHEMTAYMHFNCPICNVEFKKIGHWTSHINGNHNFFRPSHIFLTMTTVYTGIKRLRGAQRARPYCLKCDQPLHPFKGYRCLWVEQLRHTPYSAFNCGICSRKFNVLRLLLHHFNTAHTFINKKAITSGRKSLQQL